MFVRQLTAIVSVTAYMHSSDLSPETFSVLCHCIDLSVSINREKQKYSKIHRLNIQNREKEKQNRKGLSIRTNYGHISCESSFDFYFFCSLTLESPSFPSQITVTDREQFELPAAQTNPKTMDNQLKTEREKGKKGMLTTTTKKRNNNNGKDIHTDQYGIRVSVASVAKDSLLVNSYQYRFLCMREKEDAHKHRLLKT